MDHLVRSSGLRGYGAMMLEMGYDPAPLLRRYHIPPDALGRDEALLSLRAAAHLLEASAELTGCPDFGLRLSRHQSIDVLGALSIVLRNAPTVRDALSDVARYLHVHSRGISVALNERKPVIRDTVELSVELHLSGYVNCRQVIDLCLADAHHFTQLSAGGEYDLRAVSIPHDPSAGRAAYERFFKAPLLPEPARPTLHIARAAFDAPVQGANATLRHIAEDYIFRHFGTDQGSMSERVRQVLRQTLGASACDKNSVAALLALHPRTLQRRLAEEGTSFEVLKDEVRKHLTLYYLRDTGLTIGQIALLLGFPAQSALSRACRQWFDLAPTSIRQGASPENLA